MIDTTNLTRTGFSGELIRPGDEEYQTAKERWSRLAERNAGLVVYPRTTEDVAAVVKFAVEGGHQVVIKGGGHGGAPSSSSEGGIVIDLSAHLNSVVVDSKARTATVGGGARWSAIDAETQKYGLATVSPSHSAVGVGGFVLGGGFGSLTGKMGPGCDQLINATLVTASGDIVAVSEETEPELLWGLRGGGCNFGALTSLTLRIDPEPEKIFGGSLIYPPPKFEAVWQAVNEFRQSTILPEDYLSMVLTQGPKGPAIVLSLAHHGFDAALGKEHFKPFFDFDLGPIMDNTKLLTNPELNALTDAINPNGRFVVLLHATHNNTPLSTASGVWEEMMSVWKQPEFGKSSMLITFFDPTKTVDPQARAKSCFASRGEWGNAIIILVWEAKDDGEQVREKAIASARRLQQAWGGQQGVIPYGNTESDQGVGDERSRVIFDKNYERLQALKARWDPNQVWCSWFPIIPQAAQNGARA